MDAAAIEQTNAVRKSLGLAPLPVPNAALPNGPSFKDRYPDSDSDDEPASTLETREAAGFGNYQKHQNALRTKQRRAAQAAAIRKAKDLASRDAKLEGKALGDSDGDLDQDAKAWLRGSDKRQRRLEQKRARRLEEELAERERLATLKYDEKDLAGVRVAHEVGAFNEEDGEQILTLKDSEIKGDDESGDELENVNLREQEKLKEKLESKKRRPVYDPNAINENGESKILQQYDEEIDGKKRKRLILDGQGSTTEGRELMRLEVSKKLKAQPINLDILKEGVRSDYMDISEIKMKKPKKSKKSTRKRAADEDDIFPAAGNVNAENGDEIVDIDKAPLKRRSTEISFGDDNDLQALIAAQRRAATKKAMKRTPEDIIAEIKAHEDGQFSDTDAPGLLIEETAMFVENLDTSAARERARKTAQKKPAASPEVSAGSDDDREEGDIEMSDLKPEDEHSRRIREGIETSAVPATGLEGEKSLDDGLGATLSLLRDRGIVKGNEIEQKHLSLQNRELFRQEKERLMKDFDARAKLARERERQSGRWDRMSNREREEYARRENAQRDYELSKAEFDLANKGYRPSVELKYVDEKGNRLSQQQAFKELSHQFHGKGSGKMKTEKQLKKLEDAKAREAASVLDSSRPVGYNNAAGTTARKNKQAGVRLA